MTGRFLLAAAVVPLAACGQAQHVEKAQQYGANPVLPKPHEELIADVGVAKVVGWKDGETPAEERVGQRAGGEGEADDYQRRAAR